MSDKTVVLMSVNFVRESGWSEAYSEAREFARLQSMHNARDPIAIYVWQCNKYGIVVCRDFRPGIDDPLLHEIRRLRKVTIAPEDELIIIEKNDRI
jgi:hypothetical protein